MTETEFSRLEVASALAKLPFEGVLAFSLSCAERLLPNYERFVREHSWGNVGAIRNALDVGWAVLGGQIVDPEVLRTCHRQCEEVTPDTEEFDSPYVSAGLDAAGAACLVLDLVKARDPVSAADIASLAHDTVDMYVQELLNLDSGDREFENKILLHPLMQRELHRQRADLDLLKSVVFSGQTISVLKSEWRDVRRSNIDLVG
jgi:uncharacterized protein YjaG (DUF416 family)